MERLIRKLEIMASQRTLSPPDDIEPSFDYLATAREAAAEIARLSAEVKELKDRLYRPSTTPAD